MLKRLLLFSLVFVGANSLLATDSEPVMKTKLCNPAETNCTNVTSGLAAHVNLRDNAGTEFGTATNPIYTSGHIQLPGFVVRSAKVLAAGATSYSVNTMTDDIAISDFHFGGRGPGQAAIFRTDLSYSALVPSGGFNSSGDVSTWTNTSIGSSAGISWVYNTAQSTEGSGSASHTFTQSDQNNYPEITYTWSTPQDFNAYRYIIAQARVTVAAGGSQTRTISIILEDVNAATRTYSLSGTTTTAPFSTEQWHTITGDIESPTSSTGTFDSYNVSKIHLRLQDGGNKTGTIYWDNVHFEDSMELIERIYIDANRTFQLIVNPVELFSVGETLTLRFKNNDSVSREFTATAKGVEQ